MRDSIRNIPTEALECRDNRCHWQHYRPLDTKHPRYWGTYRHDRCDNGCGNVRRRIENSDGSIATGTTTYEYSPAYEAAKSYTREEARMELNRRARADKKATQVIRGGRGRRNLRAVV